MSQRHFLDLRLDERRDARPILDRCWGGGAAAPFRERGGCRTRGSRVKSSHGLTEVLDVLPTQRLLLSHGVQTVFILLILEVFEVFGVCEARSGLLSRGRRAQVVITVVH